MLPFLKNKEAMVSANAEDESIKRKPDDGEEFEMLDAICEDMMEAMHSKNHKLLKSALGALCEHIQDMDAEQDEQTLDEGHQP